MRWVALLAALAALPVQPGDRAELSTDAHSPKKVARNSKDTSALHLPASFVEGEMHPVSAEVGTPKPAKAEVTLKTTSTALTGNGEAPRVIPEIEPTATSSSLGAACPPRDLYGGQDHDYVCDNAGIEGKEGFLLKTPDTEVQQAIPPVNSGCHHYFGVKRADAEGAGIGDCAKNDVEGYLKKQKPLHCPACKVFYTQNKGKDTIKVLGTFMCNKAGEKAVECADLGIVPRSSAALVGALFLATYYA